MKFIPFFRGRESKRDRQVDTSSAVERWANVFIKAQREPREFEARVMELRTKAMLLSDAEPAFAAEIISVIRRADPKLAARVEREMRR